MTATAIAIRPATVAGQAPFAPAAGSPTPDRGAARGAGPATTIASPARSSIAVATGSAPPIPWPRFDPSLFSHREAWLAAGFVGAAAAIAPFDGRIARWSQTGVIQGKPGLTRAADFFNRAGSPGVIVAGFGLWAAGRITRQRRIAELGLRATEAIVISGWVTGGVKGFVGRARPYIVGDTEPASLQLFRGLLHGEHYQSFPSGHATAAFAFASVMAGESAAWWPRSRWWSGFVWYGGATAVGLARIHDDRHWASDVLAGAGVGTLTGVTVLRYHHARPNTRWDRWMLPMATPALVPAAPRGREGQPRARPGVALVWSGPLP